MRILVACEESQVVTIGMRALGHEAFSCDIEPCSGGHDEWHLQTSVVPLLKMDWDMIIAFPPCTHLCVSGARHFSKKQDGRQSDAVSFFKLFAYNKCKMICIENPVGIMSTEWKKPSQIIQPWQFGHECTKTTCLWLKGLPFLKPTKIVGNGDFVEFESGKRMGKWFAESFGLSPKERASVRSKTFQGIADAMCKQWGAIENGFHEEQLDIFTQETK